jgi:hypothetical protein
MGFRIISGTATQECVENVESATAALDCENWPLSRPSRPSGRARAETSGSIPDLETDEFGPSLRRAVICSAKGRKSNA